MTADATIQEAVRLLRDAAPNATRMVLFGSYARGDAGPDSDFDFLIVERAVVDRRAEMVRLRRALQPLHIAVDVMVVTESDVAEWGHLPGTALYPALKEGKVLHEAA